MEPKRAVKWVIGWLMLSLAVFGGIFYFFGHPPAVEFITCYVLEWTLSVDNLFVFLLIFRSFKVNAHRQLRALEYGIFGAIVLRLLFILIGWTLVSHFRWFFYLFGVLLLYSAYQMGFHAEKETDFSNNSLIRWISRRLMITKRFHKDHFIFRRHGRWFATPMLLVVIAIESADVMFAVDSVPAAFSVTTDPYIIFTANLCAILGLRSLYFVLAHAERMFAYLKYGVAVILLLIGLKMISFELLENVFWIKYASLALVLGVLGVSITASAWSNRKGKRPSDVHRHQEK